jgi:hypothetical protein
MKPKPKPKNDGPLSVPMPFDEAMQRALQVKPPPEGWPEYERKLRQRRQRNKRREPASVP